MSDSLTEPEYEYAVQARDSVDDPWQNMNDRYDEPWHDDPEDAVVLKKELQALIYRINRSINLENWRIVRRRKAGPLEVME